MKSKEYVSSILLMISGILSILPVLPINSTLFPIYIATIQQDIAPLKEEYINFWQNIGQSISSYSNGQKEIQKVTQTYSTNGPSGWTPLSLSPIILISLFAILGVIAIILSLNMLFGFLPANKLKGISITNLIGIFAGLINLFFDLLIFFGQILDNTKAGLTLPKITMLAYYGVIIGIGYWCLVFAGLLLIIGSIVNIQETHISN